MQPLATVVCDRTSLLAGAAGTADSYLTYMSTPSGWADDFAIAVWQECFSVRVRLLRNVGDHPAAIGPLWSSASEYCGWPEITLGWLVTLEKGVSCGKHFVYTFVSPLPASNANSSDPISLATSSATGFDASDADSSNAASLAASNAASLAASNAASLAVSNAATLAASNAASLAASNAASLAASDATSLAASDASVAASGAASLAASNAASLAASNAASLAASNAASLAASDAVSLAASDAASRAASYAASLPAANATSNAAGLAGPDAASLVSAFAACLAASNAASRSASNVVSLAAVDATCLAAWERATDTSSLTSSNVPSLVAASSSHSDDSSHASNGTEDTEMLHEMLYEIHKVSDDNLQTGSSLFGELLVLPFEDICLVRQNLARGVGMKKIVAHLQKSYPDFHVSSRMVREEVEHDILTYKMSRPTDSPTPKFRICPGCTVWVSRKHKDCPRCCHPMVQWGGGPGGYANCGQNQASDGWEQISMDSKCVTFRHREHSELTIPIPIHDPKTSSWTAYKERTKKQRQRALKRHLEKKEKGKKQTTTEKKTPAGKRAAETEAKAPATKTKRSQPVFRQRCWSRPNETEAERRSRVRTEAGSRTERLQADRARDLQVGSSQQDLCKKRGINCGQLWPPQAAKGATSIAHLNRCAGPYA